MQFRRKQLIDAIQWTGKNTAEVMSFLGAEWGDARGIWLKQIWNGDGFDPDWALVLGDEGSLNYNDWVVRSGSGAIFIDTAAEFAEKYEAA
jgi:hypothetical protein